MSDKSNSEILDDLVLENIAGVLRLQQDKPNTHRNRIIKKAADEIERLREERDNLKVRVQELEIDVTDCNQLRAEAVEERDRYKADIDGLKEQLAAREAMQNRQIQIIQNEIREWAEGNFGKCPSWQPLLGLQEELGELSHAYLKRIQAIKLHENHDENIRDAVGDIFIFLCNFCNREGLELDPIVREVWAQVKQRNYR